MAKLLIIDDEKAIRGALRDILEYEGYSIEEASDGEQGLELVTNNDYDVVKVFQVFCYTVRCVKNPDPVETQE